MRLLYKWIFASVTVIALIIVLTILSWKDPPATEIDQARKSITKAEQSNAAVYASETLKSAKIYYDSAMYFWKQQNEKISFFRNYSQVKRYADNANSMAIMALEAAHKTAGDAKGKLKNQIGNIEKNIFIYNELYASLTVDAKRQQDFMKAKLLLHEGMLAFNNKNYTQSAKKLNSSEALITKILNHSKEKLHSYFEAFPEWKSLVKKTVNESKNKKTVCVIIDKIDRKCHLYRDGVKINSYNIELGKNWIGDKNYQGDKATPEGSYKIIKKKSGKQTRYYKALLLDYPNEDDKRRFKMNIENGDISKDAHIGNFIEIHGHGGKGSDWTDGCVALNDKDMDQLYSVCRVGTKVTIVGSVRTLNEIMKVSDE